MLPEKEPALVPVTAQELVLVRVLVRVRVRVRVRVLATGPALRRPS
jgi:hypothetical protein